MAFIGGRRRHAPRLLARPGAGPAQRLRYAVLVEGISGREAARWFGRGTDT